MVEILKRNIGDTYKDRVITQYQEWNTDKNGETTRCSFCTRAVYWDNTHYYKDQNGNEHDIPHSYERRIYKKGDIIPHWEGCKAIHGTFDEVEECAEKRQKLGWPVLNKYYPHYRYHKTTPTKIGQKLYESPHKGDDRYSTTKLNEVVRDQEKNKSVPTQQDIEKLSQEIKTLEIRLEVLTASFNDYVNITMKAIKGFFDDVHNDMTNKERFEARAESLIDSTKKIVTTGDKIINGNLDIKMDEKTTKSLLKYFDDPGSVTDDSKNTT